MRTVEEANWKTNVGNYSVTIPEEFDGVDTDSLIEFRKKLRWLSRDTQETIDIISKEIEARIK